MKSKIKNIIKYNRWIYRIYYRIFNTLLKFWGAFIRTDKSLILINSFAGRKYDDSPKNIYEEIKRDSRFKDCKIVWAFDNPEQYGDIGCKKIKTDTIEYFKTALKARVWITNSSVERGLGFKKKNTIYFNTWHGTPMKKMGTDIASDNTSFRTKNKKSYIDVMTSQGDFETDIFSRTFRIEKSKFLTSGLPRNDVLVNYSQEDVVKIKKKLNIPLDKKVILYAPTFREYTKNSLMECVMNIPMNIDKWKNELENKYVILFRVHYEVGKNLNIKNDDFVRDVTDYTCLNDLMIASDILISDYSSIFFDFSITSKPMLHFTYDFDDYSVNRGMYFDIRDYLSGSNNENDLIDLLQNISIEDETKKSIHFRDSFVQYYGNATKACVDCIFELM